MIYSQQFKQALIFTVVNNIIILSPTSWSAENKFGNQPDKRVEGSILGISGWYERYANGQLVLYPVVNIPGAANTLGSMYGMTGMSGMYGMAGMSGMYGMGGMYGMTGMEGMYGAGKYDTGMRGLYGMTGMSGMSGMTGMNAGMSGMGDLSGNYQMTFGRFWITKDGNLILYPVTTMFGAERSEVTNMGGDK